VPQEILDANQRRIRIEHLGGHGVALMPSSA
jgi:hypothetical protein